MKKFYFGGDEEGDEEDEEGFDMPHPSEMIAMGQFESPAKYLLDAAVRVCERQIMWSFMSPEDKLAAITKVFRGLVDITEEYERDATI